MFTFFLFISILGTHNLPPPILTAVLDERTSVCSTNEFSCTDGACVSLDHLCDGRSDCADASDEAACYPTMKNQWKCRDGTCIGFDGKCDGAVDCPDRSDESHALCRKNVCQSNWFRCTYGACVDGSARCDGVQDCADNSDELHPKCQKNRPADKTSTTIKCDNGELVDSQFKCDGVANCADGSDETVKLCGADKCPRHLFQCAYGACVDGGSDCNGKIDCADGSDETDELCNRIGSNPTFTTTTTIKPNKDGSCILPPYPEHGTYSVGGVPSAAPGQTFNAVQLNVTCGANYEVGGQRELYCFNGFWSGDLPSCVRVCRLQKHVSVEYRCLINSGTTEGTRACNEFEPTGTVVVPECKKPNYYSSNVLSYMRCIDGSWDYVAICTAECGRVTPGGSELALGGRYAARGELPWHAGIYSKDGTVYTQICGGSIVSTTVVISAAHCFWNKHQGKVSPESQYAIAAGKINRSWDNEAQKTDVSKLHVPVRFQGESANFQEDIAVVVVVVPFVYKTYLRPICLDFDINFDRRQLQHGVMGKVAGWGYSTEHGEPSELLKVVDIPYIKIEECIAESPINFREFITSDKICAGYRNGTSALCHGDSGGGLAFLDSGRGTERFYLRGIVSVVPQNEFACNAYAMTSFTHVTKHETFIKEWLSV